MTYELMVIGGGNMGAALLGGMLRSEVVAPSAVVVVEPSADRRTALSNEFPGVTLGERIVAAHNAIIAVKPQHVVGVVRDAAAAGVERFLSIAAGITGATIADAAGPDAVVVRSMPNTPALVGEGVFGIAAGPGATASDLDWAESLLRSSGLVVRVDESQIDAVTGLTGSGPAYVFAVAEALIDAGRQVGLPEALLEPMVSQLLVGSAALLAERGDPESLRVAVTSPGGTTAAGLAVLGEHGLGDAFVAAVAAATERGRELGLNQ